LADFLAEIAYREFREAYAAKVGKGVAGKPRRVAAAANR
jgi:hypothetical protein